MSDLDIMEPIQCQLYLSLLQDSRLIERDTAVNLASGSVAIISPHDHVDMVLFLQQNSLDGNETRGVDMGLNEQDDL